MATSGRRVAKFEDWDPAGRTFDSVIAAQAWHWVDPVAGAAKAAARGVRLEDRLDEVVTNAEARAGHDRAAESAAEELLEHAPAALLLVLGLLIRGLVLLLLILGLLVLRLLVLRLLVLRLLETGLLVLGLHVGIHHRVDGLQQQRHLPLLLLHSQRHLPQVEHPLAGVAVASGGSGLHLAGQRLDQRCCPLSLLL
jgi:hypothetical protein